MEKYKIYIAGEFVDGEEEIDVINPYSNTCFAKTFLASLHQIEKAINFAYEVFNITKNFSSYERSEILERIASKMNEQKEDLSKTISQEAGKPIRDSIREVERAIFTVKCASEEAKRIYGEVMSLDLLPITKGKIGITKRFPIGPILAITPFNFPLNLAMHKLAPAIAAGNTVVVKPSSKTPIIMLKMAKIIEEAGLPKGALSVVPTKNYDALVLDDRFKLVTFTGSSKVGWEIKKKIGKKKILLELGGNAGLIIDENVDINSIMDKVIYGSFGYAGQICISIQRIYVHESLYSSFCDLFTSSTKRIKLGDPLDPETFLGPMIDKPALERAKEWVDEAVASGAKILTGGNIINTIFEPTILTDVPKHCKVYSEEVFAPVVIVYPFKNFKDAVREVNDSKYGLQAGVFTKSLDNALYAFNNIETGGVIINDIPTFRIDPMPYGGVKDSGIGKEGIKYAIEEMTELKLMVIQQAM
jgi:glyceraldehyde-3-phosphate dehydrogenase (NADP+)